MDRTLGETLENIGHTMEILERKAQFWTFSRLLCELYEGEEPLQELLARRLLQYGKDAAAKKVGNWMRDKNLPGNREELFKICFALGFDLEKTEHLLGTTAESGIHYRNPKELIYAFCIRKGYGYPQAKEMAERLWEEPLPSGTLEYRASVRKSRQADDMGQMTYSIRDQFRRVDTERELEEFLAEYKMCFGFHHNTAYHKFVKMLEYLMAVPDEHDGLPSEKKYSVERVVEEYLRMGMPYRRNVSGQSKIQREIKRHWPTSKTVNEMYTRKIDVDRKTLLLLYLATEGMEAAENADRAERMEEHRRRLDLMMAECGMAALSLHSPFDYLVLQAIRAEGEEDFMSLRMEWMLRGLFSEKKKAAYVVVTEE